MSKNSEIEKIKKEILQLKESPLYRYRLENSYVPVVGEGSLDTEVVLVGEAPGKNEAKTGKPFCGASGNVLNQLLEHIAVTRTDVYITNIVKDRPQDNRDPSLEEINLYAPFLKKQFEIIQPKIIATLGRFAMEYVMKEFGLEDKIQIISNIHGKVFRAKSSWGVVKIIPLYHPAVAVYKRKQLEVLKKDFESVRPNSV